MKGLTRSLVDLRSLDTWFRYLCTLWILANIDKVQYMGLKTLPTSHIAREDV